MEKAEIYKSNISLGSFKNKLYVDPYYGLEHNSSVLNYSVFSDEWDIEDVREDHIIKIIHRSSGATISLSFNTLKDKLNFAKNIYAAKPVRQLDKGMDLEKLANNHLKPSANNPFNNILNKLTFLF